MTKKIKFSIPSVETIPFRGESIDSFLNENDQNIDEKTVKSFGEEWSKFSSFDSHQIEKAGNEYFDLLPKSILNKSTVVLDIGCGSGRWSKYLAPKVGFIECMDPSKAVFSAIELLKNVKNVRVVLASVDSILYPDESFEVGRRFGNSSKLEKFVGYKPGTELEQGLKDLLRDNMS